MTKILLVCRANICRSPMALAVCAQYLAQLPAADAVVVCAAGTHAVPGKSQTDPRVASTLQRHGYRLPRQRTRAVQAQDFAHFDRLLAMDHSNLEDLRARCAPAHQHKLQLFLQDAYGVSEHEVPDPYFGAITGFERVLRLCEAGAQALVLRCLGALGPGGGWRDQCGSSRSLKAALRASR